MFAIKYALKSISRRKLKNLSLVFAISIGVTMLVAAQIANEGMVNVYAKASLDGLGKTDITVTNPVDHIGFFPENVTEYIENQVDNIESKTTYIAPKLRYLLPIYDPSNAHFERAVFVNGIYPNIDGYDNFYDMNGDIINLEDIFAVENGTLISHSLAEQLDLSVSDILTTSVPNGNGNFSQLQIIIQGIYDDSRGRGIEGVFPPFTTEHQIYLHIADLQNHLVDQQNQINVIDIALADNQIDRSVEEFDPKKDEFPGMDQVENLISEIQPVALDVLPTVSIRSERIELLSTIDDQLIKFSATINTFIILINLTALLLIVNVQSMNIEDRKNQAAVLRALGNKKGTIIKIFLYETVILGLLGSVIAIWLGIWMGDWIQSTINDIFGLSGISPVIQTSTVIYAILLGVGLAALTAILPTLKVTNRPISEALRGIEKEEEGDLSKKIIIIGLLLMVGSSIALFFLGETWIRGAWTDFNDQLIITIILEIFLTGLFFILSQLLNQRFFLTLWGLSFVAFAVFNRNIAYYLVINPILEDIVNWFLAMMFFGLIGTLVIIAVNFDILMKLLEKIMFVFKSLRATMQVSVAQLIDKKARMILIFSILTIIMVISLFFSSLATSDRVGLVNQFEWRSQGINIVVDVEAPVPGIEQSLEQIEGVTEVFSFKKTRIPIYTDDPTSSYFDPQRDVVFSKSIIEVSSQTLKPNGVWDESALALSIFGTDDNLDYNYRPEMSPDETQELSQQILDDFFNNSILDKPVIHTDDDGNSIEGEVKPGQMVLGGFNTGFYNDLIDRTVFLPGINESLPVGLAGGVVDMMGDPVGFGNVVLVTPELATQLPSLQEIQHPNLFLLRTEAGYFDDSINSEIANEIEQTINNLNPSVNPLCSSGGCTLVGASTRLVHEQYKQLFELDSKTWEFFALFSFFALIIGVVGMIIISIRSVGERTQEIGMRRAIGFKRKAIVTTLALELFVVVVLGIIIGIFNSILNVEFFALKVYKTKAVYPYTTIMLNIGLLFFSSLLAGIIPAYRASKIPPSQALRYTG